MLCLTIQQPHAELIVAGLKQIEVRTWWPRFQLPVTVAIHAGKQIDGNAPDALWEMLLSPGLTRSQARMYLRQCTRLGGVVGVARLTDRIRFGSDPYYRAQGGGVRSMSACLGREQWERLASEHLNPLDWWNPKMVGFRFDQPVRFEKVIPCRGRQGFFELPAEIEAQVTAQMGGER